MKIIFTKKLGEDYVRGMTASVLFSLLPVVLYWCKTLCLTLREEQRLRVNENRVLRGIFGPEREEVAEGWRKLHNWEFHNL
jgi:hypothetical protein